MIRLVAINVFVCGRYDPNLDGVTPTLCAIAPLVRSQSDHKPGSESTLKRKGESIYAHFVACCCCSLKKHFVLVRFVKDTAVQCQSIDDADELFH